MQLILFSILLVVLYLGILLGLNIWLKRNQNSVHESRLQPVVAAFLMSGFMLGLMGDNFVFSKPNLSLYTCIVGALFALLYALARWPNKKIIWLPIVCSAGTYIIHKAFPALEIGIGGYVVMAAVWSAVMWCVMFLDKLPLLSFLTAASWSLALSIMGLLNNFFPAEFVVVMLTVFASLWAVTTVLMKLGYPILGVYGSSFLGFIMGGLIAACVAFKAYGTGVAFTGYYLFELFMFALAWLGFHPLNMTRGDFAFSAVLRESKSQVVVKTLFYHQIILAMLALFIWQRIAWVVLVPVVLLDTYFRFKNLVTPMPTVKEMWRNTKSDVKKLFEEEKECLKMIMSKERVSNRKYNGDSNKEDEKPIKSAENSKPKQGKTSVKKAKRKKKK